MRKLFSKLSSTKSRFILALLHAIVLLLLNLMWMNSPLVYEDEYFQSRILTVIKRIILGAETKPNPERFLFLNIAYNKQFIPKLGESGEALGDQVITDRKVLANILAQIATSKQKPSMVVMDVVLEDSAPGDSLLLVTGKKLGDRLILAANETEGQVVRPSIPLPYAVASYSTLQEGLLGMTSDAFFKYQPITPDGNKTLSLQVYEKLHGSNTKLGTVWNRENNSVVFRSFIIDHPIRYYDLFLAPQEQRFPMLYANDFLLLPQEIIEEFVAKRLIYIGDFELADMHETVYGSSPGTLILANQLLALEKGEQCIHFVWVFYMLVCFGLLSYQCFWNENPLIDLIRKVFNIKKSKHLGRLNNFTQTLGSVTVISVISYFVFGISIGIFFVTLYLQLIQTVQSLIGQISRRVVLLRRFNRIRASEKN